MNLSEPAASLNGRAVSVPPHGPNGPVGIPGRLSVAERRARLVIQCACDLQGIAAADVNGDLRLPISVAEFESELRRRYSASHPDLIYRTDSTLERARLERTRFPHLPRVILRRGAPPRMR
jgi:hypothetical protein